MPVKLHVATWNVFTEILSGTTYVERLNATTARQSLENRLRMLYSVVNEAFTILQQPHNLPDGTDYLRIFLAPEYYFSRAEDRHLIADDEVRDIQSRLEAFSHSVPDVLLVPGTIAYYKPYDKPGLTKNEARQRQEKYGHILKGEAKRRKVKRKNLYLAHNTAYVYLDGRKIFSHRKHMDAHEVKENEAVPEENKRGRILFAPGSGDGVFDLAMPNSQLTIGIEICADHHSKVLQDTGRTVDILLVPHASVTVRPDETSVRPGGYLVEARGGMKDILVNASHVWKKGDNGVLSQVDLGSNQSKGSGKPTFSGVREIRRKLKEDKQTMRDGLNEERPQQANQFMVRYKATHGGILQLFELDYQ